MSPSLEDPRGLIRYALAGAALSVVLLWTLYLARGALLLIYLSALVAIGLGPVVDAIERRRQGLATRRRVPRWLAILTIYLRLAILQVIFEELAPESGER